MHYIIKLGAVLAVCFLSALSAVYFTENHVIKVMSKQKSISDAMFENQIKQAMKEAEDIAKAELSEKNIIAETVTLETKPIITELTTVSETEISSEFTSEESLSDTSTAETVLSETSESISERKTEYKKGGLLDDIKKRPAEEIKKRSVLTLTEQENKYFKDYLIKHYFLNGFVYAERETDSAFKEKKLRAAEMQEYVSGTLDAVTSALDVSDISSLLSTDYDAIIADVMNTKTEYETKYSDCEKYGAEYKRMYDSSIAYFDRLIKALNAFKKSADDCNNAANPLFAAALFADSINNVIIPEAMAVVENSFDIVECAQEIFLDGTRGEWLLTREEVSEILSNPGLILSD